MLPALLEAYDDPYYETGVWKVFQTTLSYATAYPPLARWGDVENAVQEEFRNILTAYIAKNYSDEKVQEYLDTAADRVNRALARIDYHDTLLTEGKVIQVMKRRKKSLLYGYFDDQNKEYVIERPDTPNLGLII